MTLIVLRTDGSEETVAIANADYHKMVDGLIGNTTGFANDTVSLLRSTEARRRFPNCRHPVMVVRGDGWETREEQVGPGRFRIVPTKARLPENAAATTLYRDVMRNQDHTIVGDVVIVDDEDFT